jgi:hypothetical protein
MFGASLTRAWTATTASCACVRLLDRAINVDCSTQPSAIRLVHVVVGCRRGSSHPASTRGKARSRER